MAPPTTMLRSPSMTLRKTCLPLLLAATTAAVTIAKSPCADFKECCELCGDNSIRCARGPCSTSFFTKGFFSISMPTEHVNFWDVVFSFYGMVPYVVPILIAIEMIVRRRTWMRVFSLLFIPIFAVVNSAILVKSLGSCSECSRPCGSCIESKGMPSGHASNSIGLCLWLLLETLIGYGRVHNLSMTKRGVLALANILLFVPVPYSRVYLGDHTPLQVGVGSANGIVFAIIYFCALRFLLAKRLDRISARMEQWRFSVKIYNDFTVSDVKASISESLIQEDEEKAS
ncbi:TPA: hypothetical protein N0F65_009307 [Lagenidium giganteum]|uniref:Phosphatidic acid phosphatase type 2/haloperoxidase domain-containing protein n=1 Tax=Lagenidium giganteum TaxID=4803 RepID=A0AAV2YRE3_9STRA|nr:TPA: hypothetical protein N0F65_009307 [Lagenidium giganteum]